MLRTFKGGKLSSVKRSRGHQRLRRTGVEKLESRHLLAVLVDGFSESVYAENLDTPTALAVDATTGTIIFAPDAADGGLYEVDPTDRSVSKYFDRSPTGAPGGIPGGFGSFATDLEFHDGLIYTMNQDKRLLEIGFDLDNFGAQAIGSYPNSGVAHGVAIKDDVVYVTSGSSSGPLYAFDLEARQASYIFGTQLPSQSRGLEYAPGADQLYLWGQRAIYEVDPGEPVRELQRFSVGAGNIAIDYEGQYAYVTRSGGINRLNLATGVEDVFAIQGGAIGQLLASDELDFGPATSGNGSSLFVTNETAGTIIEIAGDFPTAPGTTELLNTTIDASIIEGDLASLRSTIVNGGGSEQFQVSVGWGDGSTNDFTLSTSTPLTDIVIEDDIVTWDNNTGELVVRHRYLDDGVSPGNGTSSDIALVTLSVTDDAGVVTEATNSALETDLIVNGDFETGDFTGWFTEATLENPNSQLAEWFINNGSVDPLGPGEATEPIGGNFDAALQQSGRSRFLLSSHFTVPHHFDGATLSWSDRIRNAANRFETDAQEFVVSLVDEEGQPLVELYRTQAGDPLVQLGPNEREVDVTDVLASRKGERVAVAFEQVNRLFYFNINLDDISLVVTESTPLEVEITNDVPSLRPDLVATTSEMVINGGFETGDFTGWQPSSDASNTNTVARWSINDGSQIPIGPINVPAPLITSVAPISGQYDAFMEQSGPSSFLLTSSFIVPRGVTTATLSWSDRIRNFAQEFSDPDQQFRVHLVDATGQSLAEVFRTVPGDELIQLGPNEREFDVTSTLQSLEGQSVSLAFEQNNNLYYFNVNIDDVSLQVTTLEEAPNPPGDFPSLPWNGSVILPIEADGLFEQAIEFTDAGVADVHQVTVDFDGDGDVDSQFTIDPVGARTFDLHHVYTAPGVYPVTVTLTDDDGGTTTETFELTVFLNRAPEAADDILGEVTVNEDTTVTDISSLILANDSDPDGDPMTIISVDDQTLSGGELDLQQGVLTYSPAGDFESLAVGESATASFAYTISDPLGKTDTAVVDIIVEGVNDEPEIVELASSHPDFATVASVGSPVSISGIISDVDLSDEHRVTIEWGDDTESIVDIDAAAVSVVDAFSAGHEYQTGGVYSITVTVEDGNGGVATGSTTAVISGVGVVDGTLYVIGTDGRDDVDVAYKNGKNSRIEVKAKFGASSKGGPERFEFEPGSFEDVVIQLGDGKDHATIHSNRIDWYSRAVIVGGDGDDHLTGGSGSDILIGGRGRDHVQSNDGADVLIGGGVSDASSPAAIDAALSLLAGGDLEASVSALGDLIDDAERDRLQGDDLDLVVAGVRDR